MISFDEAVALIAANAQPSSIESISLAKAHGRTLAESLEAQVRSPPFDASAMDGYAVRDADLNQIPATLTVAGESFPGAPYDHPLSPGQCVRIFTGSAVPAGAGRVIIQEVVERQGSEARFTQPLSDFKHIRRAGSDFECGELILHAGTRLDPRGLVAAAAADVSEVRVWARPRVIVLSTGDELVRAGTARHSPGAIPESISFGVAAMVSERFADFRGSVLLQDELQEMQRAAALAARACDLVIVTGGASVGDKDFARAMFERLKLEVIFSKVAIKPGKPVWFGRAGATLILGLPGNPTSALVTARLLLAPLLACLNGQRVETALCWRAARLGTDLDACGDRETFHRGRWTGLSIEILSNQDSSAQKSLVEADVLVRQRLQTPALKAGATVDVLDF